MGISLHAECICTNSEAVWELLQAHFRKGHFFFQISMTDLSSQTFVDNRTNQKMTLGPFRWAVLGRLRLPRQCFGGLRRAAGYDGGSALCPLLGGTCSWRNFCDNISDGVFHTTYAKKKKNLEGFACRDNSLADFVARQATMGAPPSVLWWALENKPLA